jgi:hypothetical protein
MIVLGWEGREYHISVKAKYNSHLASNIFFGRSQFSISSQSEKQEVGIIRKKRKDVSRGIFLAPKLLQKNMRKKKKRQKSRYWQACPHHPSQPRSP